MLRISLNLLVTLWLGFLTAAVIECHRPGLLPEAPAPETPGKARSSPDVLERIEQTLWRRSAVLEISETDVNRYLASALAGRQTMPSAALAAFDRVALSFRPGLATVWLAWTVGRHQNTASLDFTITREKNNFIVEPRGGSLGRLRVFRGALATLVPGLRNLCGAMEEEIHAIFQMNQIRIEQGRLVLDPRFDKDK